MIDTRLEFLGRDCLIEAKVIGNDAARACHIPCPLPFEVRAVADAAVVVRPGVALPAIDGAVAGLVDGRLEVPVVADALRVLLEVVVGQHLVAELVPSHRLPRELFHMEVIDHEVTGACLVAPLIGTIGANA